MNYTMQFYAPAPVAPNRCKPQAPDLSDLERLQALAADEGAGVDLSKMSEEEILKRLLGA